MTWPAVVVVGGVWLVLAYLVLFDAALARRRRERAELDRCGRVAYPVVAPRFTRADPSPLPRPRGDVA